MTIRNLAIVTAIVALVNGLQGLLIPAQFIAPWGIELPEAGLLVTRIFGAHVLSLAVIDWFARNDLRGGARPGAERGIVLANVLLPAVTIVILVVGIVGGIVSAFGWATVALLAVLGVGWVYFGLLERGTGRTDALSRGGA
jgi:hypothetical protein